MLAHADAELSASSTLPRHDSLVEGMGSHPRSPVRIDTQRRREGPAKVGFATDLYGAFPVKRLFLGFAHSSLFGAGKPFFVPSPAIRLPERAEGVKGPKR